MNILAVSNHYPPSHRGGYGILCYRICEELTLRGHGVTVLTSLAENGSKPDSADMRVCSNVIRDLVLLPPRSMVRLIAGTIRNDLVVKRALRTTKPDIVYIFGIDGVGFQVYHRATESGVPSLVAVGDTWLAQAWRDLPKFDPWIAVATGAGATGLVRLIKRCIGICGSALGLFAGRRPAREHRVHVISRFLADDLHDAMRTKERMPLLHTPVPLPPPYISLAGEPSGRIGARTDVLRALFVSRMERGKGPDTAILAVKEAVDAGADVVLTIAGIPLEAIEHELRALAASIGIAERVKWVGELGPAELFRLYREHDVFVFPTRIIEGFGIVCAEAMACGLPVLATTTGGQTDLVINGYTGFLFAPSDFAALGGLLARLAKDRSLLDALSANAQQMVRAHHAAKVVDRVETLLEECRNNHSMNA